MERTAGGGARGGVAVGFQTRGPNRVSGSKWSRPWAAGQEAAWERVTSPAGLKGSEGRDGTDLAVGVCPGALRSRR